LVYLLFATLVVASCSEQSSFLAPVPTDTQPTQVALVGCPSMDQVCADLKPIVRQACPPDSISNNGARAQCRKKAFNEAIKPYKNCFSRGEINAIRRCVFEVTPSRHGKYGGDQPYDQPDPNE